ncbi:type II toxin-antitoxin system RelE/ParE family toxin [Streptomyces sp. NPDC060334]|uniref:type II toxin-antitoxin system RelE/ParE family toxin n=1 Tax=unclassified Streptomyces TaxID=2593676 RepID=UPI0033261685
MNTSVIRPVNHPRRSRRPRGPARTRPQTPRTRVDRSDRMPAWRSPRAAPTPHSTPFARPLTDGVYELRPTLDGIATRITYWFAPGRRIVMLTVFRKTRMRETAQVNRAVTARTLCEQGHEPAHTTYSRSEEGDAS